jgi:hypothetical protein
MINRRRAIGLARPSLRCRFVAVTYVPAISLWLVHAHG